MRGVETCHRQYSENLTEEGVKNFFILIRIIFGVEIDETSIPTTRIELQQLLNRSFGLTDNEGANVEFFDSLLSIPIVKLICRSNVVNADVSGSTTTSLDPIKLAELMSSNQLLANNLIKAANIIRDIRNLLYVVTRIKREISYERFCNIIEQLFNNNSTELSKNEFSSKDELDEKINTITDRIMTYLKNNNAVLDTTMFENPDIAIRTLSELREKLRELMKYVRDDYHAQLFGKVKDELESGLRLSIYSMTPDGFRVVTQNGKHLCYIDPNGNNDQYPPYVLNFNIGIDISLIPNPNSDPNYRLYVAIKGQTYRSCAPTFLQPPPNTPNPNVLVFKHPSEVGSPHGTPICPARRLIKKNPAHDH